VVSNDDLSKIIDTNDEWITQRTGIKRRHVLGVDDSLGALAVSAAQQALQSANVAPEDVDMVLLATSTPDDLFGTAPRVASGLGCSNAVAFDLTAACSGFVFALVTASQYIRTGAVSTVVVIGADCLSRWVDWSDRGTCILFGDGAGAAVVRATAPEDDRLLRFDLGSDGKGGIHLGCSSATEPVSLGDRKQGSSGSFRQLQMNGKEVFRFATQRVPLVLRALLDSCDMKGEDIDWLLLHQANRRIMDSAAKRFRIPQEKIICNLDEYGNTSAASIPLALDEAIKDGRVLPGQLLAIVGFGAGLSWGGCLLRI
jgi:3-oxoacyl-[acyl-carrier-protein] synthase-3